MNKFFSVCGMFFVLLGMGVLIYFMVASDNQSSGDQARRALGIVVFLFCFANMIKLYTERGN